MAGGGQLTYSGAFAFEMPAQLSAACPAFARALPGVATAFRHEAPLETEGARNQGHARERALLVGLLFIGAALLWLTRSGVRTNFGRSAASGATREPAKVPIKSARELQPGRGRRRPVVRLLFRALVGGIWTRSGVVLADALAQIRALLTRALALVRRWMLRIESGLPVLLAWVAEQARALWAAILRVTGGRIRLAGLLLIAVALPCQRVASAYWWDANATVVLVVFPVVAFLWLAMSGRFGFGGLERRDWPALFPLGLAFVAREGLAHHTIQSIQACFFYGTFRGRHNFVLAALNDFLQRGSNPFLLVTHVNGVAGALASVPLYLFARHRTGSRAIATVVAAFFAAQPVVAQNAVRDGPYSLLFLTWFSGLALLSCREPGAGSIVGGILLLGFAAVCRQEGPLVLFISALILDLRALWTRARAHMAATIIAGILLAGLLTAQYFVIILPALPHGDLLPSSHPIQLKEDVLVGLAQRGLGGPVLAVLVPLGALIALFFRRFRFGLGMLLGAIFWVFPFGDTYIGGEMGVYYYVPTLALQAILAGLAVGAATVFIVRVLRLPRWSATLPGGIAALAIVASSTSFLAESNAVADEFELVRKVLAPGGKVATDCSIVGITFAADIDLHSFTTILPGMDVTYCNLQDCRPVLAQKKCLYYVRSLTCWFSPEKRGVDMSAPKPQDFEKTLAPNCARLEQALDLSEVAETFVEPRKVWPLEHGYTRSPVPIAVYRVLGLRGSIPGPGPEWPGPLR
jgi:hypothetical protein